MPARPNPRKLAVRVLRQVEQRKGFSNRILSEHLERAPDMERRDRGLATHLVYGVLRQRGRLDHLIDAVATKPQKLKGELRELLRVAVYEVVELDREVRVAAAEAGKLARAFDKSGRLGGLVTAIVANVARRRDALELALAEGPPIDQLVHRYALPRWLAQRWSAQLGDSVALARAKALLEAPRLDLRVDLHRGDRATVAQRLAREAPGVKLELPEEYPATLKQAKVFEP